MKQSISYVSTVGMPHDEWLSRRKLSIGGSDAAAIVGLNMYTSAYSLFLEKTGKVDGFSGNLATEVGAYLEEFVAKKFEQETGKRVKRRNAFIYNSLYPFAHANVDRVIVGEPALLEIKTVDSLSLSRFKNGEYPPNFYVQMMHYLAVTGEQRCYLAVLIGNRQFKTFTVERDEDEIAALMTAEADFWNMVQTDTPPDICGADVEPLSDQYPESDPDEYADLTGAAADLAIFEECTRQIKELEEKQNAAKARIMLSMGTCENGGYGGYAVSWKTQKRNTFDRKKWEKENGKIPDEYFKTSESRTFRFKKEN